MQITDELIGYIGDLSRLYLSDEEKERAKKDLSDVLDYTEKLNELDTEGLPEMSHPFEAVNRFREVEARLRLAFISAEMPLWQAVK